MIKFAEKGNNIFIAARGYSNDFANILDFKTELGYYFTKDLSILNFENKKIDRKNGYLYKKAFEHSYFSSFDTTKTVVLGKINNNDVNYIKIPCGKGYFFINTQPVAFTNYALLNEDNSEYAYKALSYLPSDGDVIWDEFYKPYNAEAESPLRYVFNSLGLKTAYISVLMYMLFTAKRRQRIIPIITPLKNTSLNFIETIAVLYYHKKNHKDIALKKYNYFLETLRSKYYINTDKPEELDYKLTSEKTGKPVKLIKNIFKTVIKIQKTRSINEKELELFNNYIEDFYKK